jgi:hypothetical protein
LKFLKAISIMSFWLGKKRELQSFNLNNFCIKQTENWLSQKCSRKKKLGFSVRCWKNYNNFLL